jgi:hypothetical protein
MEDEKNYIFFFLFFFLEKKTQGFCIIYDVFGSKDVSPVKSLLCSMMCLAILRDFGVSETVRPTLIYEDNLACIDMSIHNDKIPRKNV